MPVTQTSLGEACEALRAHLAARLGDVGQPSTVLLGNLADAADAIDQDETLLNILVYRVESDGSGFGHNDPSQPWLVRMHLLVTAFSTDETPSVGHNEMRMLGEAAALLHEQPILPVTATAGGDVALQLVPETLSVETLNQLWSVQGEVRFRASVGYDVGLVPLVSSDPPVGPPPPLVSDVQLPGAVPDVDGLEGEPGPDAVPVWASAAGRADLRYAGAFVDDTTPFPGETAEEAVAREARAHDEPARLRVFERGSARLAAFVPRVTVVADRPQVRLVWEVRTGRDPVARLVPADDPVVVDALVHRPLPEEIDPGDPARFPGVQVHELQLPPDAALPDGAYQLVLRAVPPDAADPLTAPALEGRPVLVSVADPAVD